MAATVKYRRVLLKVSGEALMGDREYGLDPGVLDRIAAALRLDTVDRLSLHVAAGFLDSETARLLADPDLTALAAILTGPETAPRDAARLRLFVTLALEHAAALGYRVRSAQEGG